ncbi:MAG: glutamate 5-kinase [Planctomycetaceae bacterium]|jgi:glutamate 5-kinase|nr:glutamate 5-kinase [Planctomycetaceae bacterium]
MKHLRQQIVQKSQYVVVKVGTNVLTHDNGLLNIDRIEYLVDDILAVRELGKKVILVSSGAVGAGMGRLGLKDRPTENPKLQAIAAIGQGKLMETYEELMSRSGAIPAQALLTADDLSSRKRYLNTRNTIRSILDFGAIPIINENDTVSVQELHSTFGDNDRLAALVANLFERPLLILLTDVDGLFDGEPASPTSQRIPLVEKWSPSLMQMVAEKKSSRGKGGMSSKLTAAKMTSESGGHVIIANGETPGNLIAIFNGEDVGTLFRGQNEIRSARKRWIGYAGQAKGSVTVDDGAAAALHIKRKSLLPIGVLDCKGEFQKGDVVLVLDKSGNEIARGLSNYSMKDVSRICGKKTNEIKQILDVCPYEEIIHCDNIQITD